MAVQDDVVRIKKSLEKMMHNKSLDNADGKNMLSTLKNLPMTLEVLQKTRIGITVNNFRKITGDEEIGNLAKGLIKSWKKLVHDDRDGQRHGSRSSRSSSDMSSRRDSLDSTLSCGSELDDSTAGDQSMLSVGDTSLSETGEGQSPLSEQPRGEIVPFAIPEASPTKDPVRVKCREMLAAALKTPPEVSGAADVDDIAAALEDAVFKEFKSTETKYKNRIRSRIANLKDSKNPRLRENVLLCHVSIPHLAVMTPEEMASDEMKKIRERLSREAFNDHQMVLNSGTQTDLFKCNRCHKRNTTYNQLQTRSCDEPMTTFVYCNECGNRWKFC